MLAAAPTAKDNWSPSQASICAFVPCPSQGWNCWQGCARLRPGFWLWHCCLQPHPALPTGKALPCTAGCLPIQRRKAWHEAAEIRHGVVALVPRTCITTSLLALCAMWPGLRMPQRRPVLDQWSCTTAPIDWLLLCGAARRWGGRCWGCRASCWRCWCSAAPSPGLPPCSGCGPATASGAASRSVSNLVLGCRRQG